MRMREWRPHDDRRFLRSNYITEIALKSLSKENQSWLHGDQQICHTGTVTFQSIEAGLSFRVPTSSNSSCMRPQNRNQLCNHIFAWLVCLASVFTCCEFQMLAVNLQLGLIMQEMKIMLDLSSQATGCLWFWQWMKC